MADPFFDTNILIDWLFDREPAKVELERYAAHRISRVVWAELMAGEPVDRRQGVQHRLQRFEVVEVNQRIAVAAADIRYRTRMKLLDALILATAQVDGAVLVTRNTKDFPATMPGVRIPYTI